MSVIEVVSIYLREGEERSVARRHFGIADSSDIPPFDRIDDVEVVSLEWINKNVIDTDELRFVQDEDDSEEIEYMIYHLVERDTGDRWWLILKEHGRYSGFEYALVSDPSRQIRLEGVTACEESVESRIHDFMRLMIPTPDCHNPPCITRRGEYALQSDTPPLKEMLPSLLESVSSYFASTGDGAGAGTHGSEFARRRCLW